MYVCDILRCIYFLEFIFSTSDKSGTSITVFELAKAIHKILQIPLTSAANLAIEVGKDNCYIDLNSLMTKPKFHDEIFGEISSPFRNPEDAQLLLSPLVIQNIFNKPKGLELPSLDGLVAPYANRDMELRVISPTSPSHSYTIKSEPSGVFRDYWGLQSGTKGPEEMNKTVSIRVLDFFGLAILIVFVPPLYDPTM